MEFNRGERLGGDSITIYAKNEDERKMLDEIENVLKQGDLDSLKRVKQKIKQEK